jgi:signal transduction histidine kinase
LQRRLYRKKVDFSGADITKFIRELFSNRLERHGIVLEGTPAFQTRKIFGFPSTFYPVFVNLVDNAIFWLRDQQKPKIIRFDARGTALLISDTGPGISSRDRQSIFELGFTRKPSGRGLGLYISKEVLDREGYALSVAEISQSSGATFVIEPK